MTKNSCMPHEEGPLGKDSFIHHQARPHSLMLPNTFRALNLVWQPVPNKTLATPHPMNNFLLRFLHTFHNSLVSITSPALHHFKPCDSHRLLTWSSHPGCLYPLFCWFFTCCVELSCLLPLFTSIITLALTACASPGHPSFNVNLFCILPSLE